MTVCSYVWIDITSTCAMNFYIVQTYVHTLHTYKMTCLSVITRSLRNTITVYQSMDLFQVRCTIHIGYKDNYTMYTIAGAIQS